MLPKLFGHMRHNVVAYLALFVALGGTGAYAANTIRTGDIVDNEVASPDVRDDTLGFGGLAARDLGPGSVGTSEVANNSLGNGDFLTGSVDGRVATDNSLTGADVADQSGVDTCTHGSARFGELCVVVGWEGASLRQTWDNALTFCTDRELRLPSLGEALAVAKQYDLPLVDEFEEFWTEETYVNGGFFRAVVEDSGAFVWLGGSSATAETVCVTTPTN